MRWVSFGLSVALTVMVIALPGATVAQDEASLRAADAEQMRIIVDEDADTQQAFMHENYMVNAPANRVMRKAQMVTMLGQGGLASETFERTIEGLQVTDDVGIVMGRETVTPSAGSQLANQFGDTILQRRFTNVFLFRDGRWRFLARQATVVATPTEAR